MREGDGMNTKTNTKPTAAEIAAVEVKLNRVMRLA